MNVNTNDDLERRREKSGRFGKGPSSPPEVTLGESAPRLTGAQRRELARRARAGTGVYSEALYDIDGAPVTVPTTVDGRRVVGTGRLEGMMDGPLDGHRKVVFDDGANGTAYEKDIVREMPPLPRDGEPVTFIDVKAKDLAPGDIIVGISDDGPVYRQVLTCTEYIAINDGFRTRVDVVFTDASERVATYQNVDVEIVERPAPPAGA